MELRITKVSEYISRLKKIGNSIAPLSGMSRTKVIADFLNCYIRFGADEEDYTALELYKKSKNERKRFTTARKNYKWLYNKHSSEEDKRIFNSKSEFNRFYGDAFKRRWISSKDSSIDEIRSFIDALGEVIVKADLGVQGIGVFKLNAQNQVDVEDFLQNVTNSGGGRHYVIEELIKQHPYMSYFNDSCVNTCRIETITDKKGKAHIVNTIMITGGKGSSISNTHSGGVMVHVDPETGEIDSKGRNPEGRLFNNHPGTGASLLGKKIPYWKEVIDTAIRLAEKRPTARYIGWDIAVTATGPEVIEGNLRPGHCTQSCDMTGRWPLIMKYL